MNKPKKRIRKSQRGAALLLSFAVLGILAIAATSYLDSSSQTIRHSKRLTAEAQASNLSDSGVQVVLRGLWRPFKQSQSFIELDEDLQGASYTSPMGALNGTIPGIGAYSAGVVNYQQVPGNSYARLVTVRSVGWVDRNENGQLDQNEANKVVDVTARFELSRSEVFDYTYFINNYGWMDGFRESDLIVNGDMRANGNFDFRNGSPTINGSVFAAVNDKLNPRAIGLLNSVPVKMSQEGYFSYSAPSIPQLSGETSEAYTARLNYYRDMVMARRRQSYSSATHGADGTPSYEDARDFVYRSNAAIVEGRAAGAVVGDAQGIRSWSRTRAANTPSVTMLDTQSTREIIMPDLSDLSRYMELSRNYRNPKSTFGDGTPNPRAGREAYVEVWNASENRYVRLSDDGVVSGSAVLVGTAEKPIRVNGPVTITQDVAIKGVIEGQGTLYAGRNVHIVGSIRYKDGPDFRNGSLAGNDAQNEKKDFLGLAARGSVLMGNPNTYGNPYPLAYMTPVAPPGKMIGTYGRYDENGVWIPAFDAMQVDGSGKRRYQSVIPDNVINSISEGVNQIDAILYSNFVGGGSVGTAGAGMVLNGTIIARDEAIVTWSLPVLLNYDNRIREREITNTPLIDLELPRSPVLLRSTWQDRGFYFAPDRGTLQIGD